MTKALGFFAAVLLSLPALGQTERERLLAPIAHYPAALRSLVIRAARNPVDVIEAARWLRANPWLQGDAAVRATQYEPWDPSVKALLAYPQVLQWMDENLDWTRRLGESFTAPEPKIVHFPRPRYYPPPVVVTRIVVVPRRHPVHVHPHAHTRPHHGALQNGHPHRVRQRS